MSIKNEYTIETNLTKTEVLNKLKANIFEPIKSTIISQISFDTDLPLYGHVSGDEFKVHCVAYNSEPHLFMALEGNVADEYNCTVLYVRPRGISHSMTFMATLIIIILISFTGMAFAVMTANMFVLIFGAIVTIISTIIVGLSRYFLRKTNKVLKKIFEEEY